MINEDGRDCTKCGRWHYWSQFYKSEEGPHGRTAQCRDCIKKKNREAYHGRRSKSAARQIKRIGEMVQSQRWNAIVALRGKMPLALEREIARGVNF
jgi:hypothetical protein